ncbi:MAG: TonB C-terminal domain-containing protein [Deltaproteobacteria bacterium]|nr:TonB C-terminal domain-containing protein [Deltaproteobacteria bacterium]
MHVDAGDHKPDSLFYRRPVSPLAILVGAVVAVAAYGSIGTMLFLATLITPAMAEGTQPLVIPVPAPPPEVEWVEARLIKLGRQFDTSELPNRQRQARTTAPERPSMVARRGARRVAVPDAGPENSIDDLVARIGTTADELAQIANRAEQEGDPDGVAEGTHSAEDGDRYATYLYGLFRRGFNMPTSITNQERRGLRLTVRVHTTPAGQIDSFAIAGTSGNADFDSAVRMRMDQARGTQLREPPEGERDRYFGTSFPVGFRPPR